MIRLLFSALLALSLFGQNPNTAQFGTAVATDQYLLAAKRLSESSLNGSINASTTTVVVSDGTQFLNWQIIRIDSEEMLIQSVSSNTLTIVSGGRGYNGTTAASHTTGAAVRGIITSWHHNQLAAEVKAIETRLRNVTGQCQDAGSTDDYACSPAPPFTAYATGMIVNFKAATANTGAATVNFNSIGATAIKKVAGGVTTALDTNDIRAGQWVTVVYDGTNFQMISALGNAGSSSGSGISSCVPSGASGTAYTCTPSPAVGSYTTGLALAFKPDVASSGSATINVNGLGLVTLAVLSMDGNLTTLSSGTIQGGIEYLAIYDGTYFVVIGTTSVHVNQVADEGSNLTKRAILNFVGNGVSCVDNSGSSRTDCTIFSPSTVQAGTPLWCRSTTGNDSYTCTLTPTLTAYTRGGCVVLDADTANTGTATIAIDGLASGVGKSILNRAGSALSNGDITANKPITMCYDGTQYIIQGDGASAGSNNDIQVNNSGAFGGGRCTMDSSQNLTCTGTVAAPVVSATGTTAGELSVYEIVANGTEYFSWLAADAITTTQRLKPPIAANAANETMKFGAPSSNISAATWGLPLWMNTTNANGYFDWTLGSAPGTNPASGDIRLYPKTGSTLCAKDSGGTETCFGSGASTISTPYFLPFGPMAVGGATITATIGSANRVYHIAANAPAALSVSNVNLGTSNFGNLAVAFYDSSCTLIGQTATTATSATGVTVAVNSAPITIPAGKFYVSWTGDATGSAIYGTSAGYVADMWNVGATPEYFYGSNASTGTTTLTFPGTCGTRTAVANGANPQPPGIILR